MQHDGCHSTRYSGRVFSGVDSSVLRPLPQAGVQAKALSIPTHLVLLCALSQRITGQRGLKKKKKHQLKRVCDYSQHANTRPSVFETDTSHTASTACGDNFLHNLDHRSAARKPSRTAAAIRRSWHVRYTAVHTLASDTASMSFPSLPPLTVHWYQQ